MTKIRFKQWIEMFIIYTHQTTLNPIVEDKNKKKTHNFLGKDFKKGNSHVRHWWRVQSNIRWALHTQHTLSNMNTPCIFLWQKCISTHYNIVQILHLGCNKFNSYNLDTIVHLKLVATRRDWSSYVQEYYNLPKNLCYLQHFFFH